MEYDWLPLMEKLGGTVEELKCYTMEPGAQFVMTHGLSVMPELLAGELLQRSVINITLMLT